MHLLSCLHRRYCNVDQHRVDIATTSYFLKLCFIEDIVDVQMLTNIDSTLCIHCVPSFLFTSSTSQWSTSRQNCALIISFKILFYRRHCRCNKNLQTSNRHFVCILLLIICSSTLSILQCWPASSRHLCLNCICFLSCLHRWYRRYRKVDRHRIDIVSILFLFCCLRCNGKEMHAK